MTTTSTGAPCAQPSELALSEAGKLATEIQDLVRQMASLVVAISHAIDFTGEDSRDLIRDNTGMVFDYVHLHQDLSPKVLNIAERIEVMGIGRG